MKSGEMGESERNPPKGEPCSVNETNRYSGLASTALTACGVGVNPRCDLVRTGEGVRGS